MRCLSKKKYNKKIKKKTLKYWHQSTGLGMGNDRTKRPASGLKRKPCHRGGGSIDSTREFDGGGGGGSGVGGNEEF